MTSRIKVCTLIHTLHSGMSGPQFKVSGGKKVSVCLQLCPTLCSLMDCSPSGTSAHGILQVRILEWVTIPFSRGSA